MSRPLKNWAVVIFVWAGIACFSIAHAQTYSSEEIIISGIGFSRFTVQLEPDAAFAAHPEAARWLRIFDRNLCWSGVFRIQDSRYNACKAQGHAPDMQLLAQLVKTKGGALIRLAVAGNDGSVLLSQDMTLRNGEFEETGVMDLINRIAGELTGVPASLGSTVAFSLRQPGRRKIIARINTHGRRLAGVSRNPFISLFPRWSPDGKSLIYTTVSRQGTAIILDRLKGQPMRVLLSRKGQFGITSGGTWFDDNERIILTLSRNGNADLYEFNLRTRAEPKRLTKHRRIDTSPHLAPDNQHIVFVSDRTGREQLFYQELDAGIAFQLTFDGSSNSNPVWSPDGTLIAYSKMIGGRQQIFIMDPFTEESRRLTRGNYDCEQPSWSPDGRLLTFSANPTGTYKLYVIFMDGSGMRRLTRIPREFEETGPNWSTRNF